MLLLLGPWLLFAPAAVAAAPDPEAPFLPFWKALPDRAGWRVLVSPAFPRTWPPSPGPSAVVRYAFAMRLRPGLADGAEVAVPWARTIQDGAGGLVVERLSPRLQPLGIQGVRPLHADEIALIGREAEVAGRLRAGGDGAADPLVRAFTCGWIGRQGVVAAAILPRHPEFQAWLACR